jgi:hypothetical protein
MDPAALTATTPMASSGWPPHGIRASVLAPLAAPVLFWLFHLPRAQDAFNDLGIVLAFGGVMAYAAMIGIGLPALGILAYFRALTFARTLALGIVAGLAVAEVMRIAQQGALFPVTLPYWLGAVIGAACAAAWWRLATR